MLRPGWLLVLVACAACARQAPMPVPIGPKPEPVPVGEVEATELADVGYLPGCLALDATHVYWTLSSDLYGHVWRIPKAGGKPEQITPEISTPGDCIVVGNEVWLISHLGLFAVPTSGGDLRPVSDVVGELAKGPDGIHVANRVAGLFRVGPGGTKTTISVPPVVSIVGGDVIVFSTERKDDTGYEYTLWRLDGDVPVELARLAWPPFQLARTGDAVMFAMSGDDGMTELYTVALSGGAPRLFARHSHGQFEMFVGDGYLWWGAASGIMRMSLTTKAISMYVADLERRGRRAITSRERLVVDDDAIYWLSIDMRGWKSATRAAIMRAPRRATSMD